MAPVTSDVVLINLVPVGAGGGLQNALSFLTQLAPLNDAPKFIVACRAGSKVHDKCEELKLPYAVFPDSGLSRAVAEFGGLAKLARKSNAKVIFTLFGAPPVISGNVTTISGFALSNIIQREVPFWNFLPWRSRIVKQVKDWFRLQAALRSDEIILETRYLYERAKGGVFANKVLHIVEMEPSVLVTASGHVKTAHGNDGFLDILYLSSPHPNKRIHLMAPIISELDHLGIASRLVVTMPMGAAYARVVEQAFIDNGVEERIKNIGPVEPKNVADALHNVDAVVNIALLESFSNNWVEAWTAKKPLISTDADWARASCENAAIYIDPLNAKDAALKIQNGLKGQDQLLNNGNVRIKELSGGKTKIEKYLDILKRHLR